MANGPGLSTAGGGEIYVRSEIGDSLTLLDVLYANQFEGESIDPEHIQETEEKFYRGAPPTWLNFHVSEQAESGGTGIKLVKREGYNTLIQEIRRGRKHHGTSIVKMFHQPGCGGTTLAMQVLWDLRKTFRCAVLTGSTSDVTNVAKEVIQLFTAGSLGHQNTVLLLLNDEQILENLQESIVEELAAQKIHPCMSPAILFTCVRKDALLQSDHVNLENVLSDTEKQKFDEKKKELSRKYTDQHKQFHGFNIMQTNFSKTYVRQACTVFTNVPKAKRPPKNQLAAFLALLNAYVPGSYLLESQCLDFLKQKDSTYGGISLEDRMEPFGHLIVTFTQDTSNERRVRMAHPVIAKTCTELMADAGVTRSDTARNFLAYFCRDEVPPYLQHFIKYMLTKRETRKQENQHRSTKTEEVQEMFSRLILDIQKEGNDQCLLVLKMASDKFPQNPFFPQTLARFYYIQLKDFNEAERWAKEAMKRDPQNSFVADTLGQVHKRHLKNQKSYAKPRELLQLAAKAMEAFKHAGRLAENESSAGVNKDGKIKVSRAFNTSGQYGYLQVCNILYDVLVDQNETWAQVLTKTVSMSSVIKSLGDHKISTYADLINSLRDDVKKRCDFLNAYLTYTKPHMDKENPSECWTTVSSCYDNYLRRPIPDLVKEIENKLGDDVEETDADTPESSIAAILKEWPVNKDDSSILMQLIEKISDSYERTYAKYFQARYLYPLFYLGKDEALSKIVPVSDLHSLLENEEPDSIDHTMSKDRIFSDLRGNLLKCYGKVKNYSIVARVGDAEIMIKANRRDSTWKEREVSFFLGFTIRGLVAFGIQTNENGSTRSCASCDDVKDSHDWTAVEPKHKTENGVTTYSLESEAGRFQCTVSALRWVCKKKVSFTYQFESWEDHQQELNMVHCTPGGPLLDISVSDGKLDDVYLPHWICAGGFLAASDSFAVLHSDEYGNFLEQVSDVTSSHVKCQPYFTTNGVLVRAGSPVKAHCNVLICKTNKKSLTLHVYLIPRDSALQQELEQREMDSGSRIIQKPNPEKSLPMLESFSLTSDAQTAEISPAQIQLSHEHRTPSFFTVFMRKAKSDFTLTLQHGGKSMWSCTITRDEYQ